MPLVHIYFVAGRFAEEVKRLADAVQEGRKWTQEGR
jgi:hypothetical protein